MFAYYNKIGKQFGESKRISYALFMATLGKGSSPREEPHAKFSLSVSPLTHTNQVAFPANRVYSVLLKHPLLECVSVQSYQGEADVPSPHFPHELLPFHATIMVKCVLSCPWVGAEEKWRTPVERTALTQKSTSPNPHHPSKWLHFLFCVVNS